MSAAPATKARRINEILLELGFASEDALAKATIEQEKTGQPLGQILVDHGVITRLELASALAEQWSDQSASIKLLPIPPPASAPRRATEPHQEDDQYAARLQDAVAELAQRVGAGPAQPGDEFDDRVTDLAERVEATVARTQRLEATLATLAESFEGVTGGVEEAFGALQSGMAGLALDLARIDTTVAELGAGTPEAPATDPALVARLEELGASVAALADRPATDPALEGQLDALAVRVESLVEATETPDASLTARIEEISAALATLAERPVADPAVIESRLDVLAARIEILGDTSEVGDLRSSLAAVEVQVAALAERPVADPTAIDGRLDAFAARVENVVTPDEVVALHESLVAFEQRLAVLAEDAGSTAALDEQAKSLAELRATVAELELRPVGDPDLDDRLARIETQFADRLAAEPDAAELERLAARLDARSDEHENLATSVAQLGARIDEMTWRDDGAAVRLEELQQQLESVASALTDVRETLAAQEDIGAPQQLVELDQGLAAIRDEVASLARSVTPADEIEQIGQRLDELAAARDAQQALAGRLEAIETRISSEFVTPHDLSEALAGARDELSSAPTSLPDPRVDRIAEDLTEVRTRLAEVSVTPEPFTDPAVQGQIDQLAMRMEQLVGDREQEASLAEKLDDLERRLPTEIVTPDELSSALERTREELASHPIAADTDPRVEQLLEDLSALRHELADVRQAPAAEPHDDTPLVAQIEALEQRLDAPRTPDPRVEELSHDIATLRDQVARAERPPATDPVVASELDTMSQRLRFMDERMNDDMATTDGVARALDALRAELATAGTTGNPADISKLEDTIGALLARVDSLAETVATGTSGTAGTALEDLQRIVDERVESLVAERVGVLARELEDRLATAEDAPLSTGAATGDGSGLDDLLERNRMTIERLGLHLGEHDRALAELMRTRNLPQRLDELAARVEELAGGAPAGGAPGTRREVGSFGASEPSTGEVKALMRRVEDAEVASQADREKLMNRLERMASSIDWRLQRLESSETAMPAADED